MDIDKILAKLIDIYYKIYGKKPESIIDIAPSGSDRRYFRFIGKKENVIATIGANKLENKCFTDLSCIFCHNGCPVPTIYGETEYGYLQTDLGDISLFSLLHNKEDSEKLIDESLQQLAKMQTIDPKYWKHAVFNKDFSRRQILWDLNYFKYEFVLPATQVYDEDKLQDDFEHIADSLLECPASLWGFMYRDFQSRNIMIRNNKPYMIDYQGGRFGPCVYDTVSLLWQAKAGFSKEFRKSMLEKYSLYFAYLRGIAPSLILDNTEKFVLFRTLQVLGAYGFRGLIQHKAHFMESIPAAIGNLKELVDSSVLDKYSELKNIALQLIENSKFHKTAPAGHLNIEVFSFSYKKGYPEDLSGNGGGFMFDCRGLHNPGRYDEFKSLTGRDGPVIDFLEQRGEVQPYLSSLWKVIDNTTEVYIKRNFSNLQIGFGCTGGRHRSVYCAEMTAKHLADKFPHTVISVLHREQEVSYKLNEKE